MYELLGMTSHEKLKCQTSLRSRLLNQIEQFEQTNSINQKSKKANESLRSVTKETPHGGTMCQLLLMRV